MTLIPIILFTFLPSLAVGLYIYFRLFAPLRKKEAGTEFVYVEDDGTVRELHQQEIDYLNAPFNYNDGARPILKKRYDEKNTDGKISGFILRQRVPRDIKIIRRSGGQINLN